jgi:hypothetical protein
MTANTYRPRLSRDQRDRLIDTAERLTGQEQHSVGDALDVLLTYQMVLFDNVECPQCGERPIECINRTGKWHCWRCDSYTNIYELLGSDSDDAEIPMLPTPN